MEKGKILDIYTDFLLSSFGQASSTNLSSMMDGEISHDKITRFLRSEDFCPKDLWHYAKSFVREIESSEGVLIVDDSIEEKPYSDENELISWHYDHSKERNVKGINFVSALYYSKGVSVPVSYELVKKTETFIDAKTGNLKRRSNRSKNEIFLDLVRNCIKNDIKFSYILTDIWYSSVENMKFIKEKAKKEFIIPLKSNRYIALSTSEKKKGHWLKLDSVEFSKNEVKAVYLEGIEFPLRLTKQIFKNENGSSGVLYLVSSDSKLSNDAMVTIYQKRWKVEEFHKSLKQNASLEMSPAKIVRTQSNHFFNSLCAFIKLERIKQEVKLNHFAIKSRLYMKALKLSFSELRALKLACT